ncbi:MAG: ABC transporter substrate-binding protein [Desulfobacterium sp.]|nr:ABC transporter substrate-binding protein [Desulfobacterium sp.]
MIFTKPLQSTQKQQGGIMKKVIVILMMVLISSVCAAESLENITWITEEYPPYNFVENGVTKGIAVDLLVAVWKKVGVNKNAGDIKVWPWNRGVNYINTKPDTCLFSTTITNERKNVLGWKFAFPIPQVSHESSNHLIAPKNKGIKFNSLDEVKKYGKKFGVVRGDVGSSLLFEAGINQDLLDEAAGPNELVKKFDKGRFDVASYGFTTIVTKMKEEGVDPEKYEVVFTFPPAYMGYAFHKDTDPALLEKIQKALNELHADGTAEKIRQQYLK